MVFKYKHRGSLIPLGQREALLEFGKIKISGRIISWLWWVFTIGKIPTWQQKIKIISRIMLK